MSRKYLIPDAWPPVCWTKLICQLAVRKFGYTGANVARFLGVTTFLVNRYAASEELPELKE